MQTFAAVEKKQTSTSTLGASISTQVSSSFTSAAVISTSRARDETDPHNTKQLTDRARKHLGLLQTGADYICIRMQVDQIQYQDANMTLHNLNHNTHQKPLLESIILTVASIYSILDDFTDGVSLPDLPRALKARSQYVRQISTTCTNALHDPSQLPAIYQAMTNLTEVMGKSMVKYQRQH